MKQGFRRRNTQLPLFGPRVYGRTAPPNRRKEDRLGHRGSAIRADDETRRESVLSFVDSRADAAVVVVAADDPREGIRLPKVELAVYQQTFVHVGPDDAADHTMVRIVVEQLLDLGSIVIGHALIIGAVSISP